MKTKTAKRPASSSNDQTHLNPVLKAGTSRRDVPARAVADRTKRNGRSKVAPLNAARTAQRAPTRTVLRRSPGGRPDKLWQLRLYVAGQTPKSLTAFANLKKICESHLKGRYHIEVIDLVEQPQLSSGDQILAIPTLVRKLPVPVRKIIGDLSDTERVLVGLDLRPAADGGNSGEGRA